MRATGQPGQMPEAVSVGWYHRKEEGFPGAISIYDSGKYFYLSAE